MKIIAHRCGPGNFPEQTIMAAADSLALGADYVEMDIHITSDGIPVICHDTNVQRIFGKDRNVEELSSMEFLALRHVKDRRYPSHTLDDVLSTGMEPILLHCKIDGESIENVLKHLRDFNYEDKVVMGVQAVDDLQIVKRFNAAIQTLAFIPSEHLTDAFIENGADIIRLWEEWVSPEKVKKIHEAGCKVWVMANTPTAEGVGYTTDKNLLSWMNMGIDGVLVNDITWAKQIPSLIQPNVLRIMSQ